MATKQGLYYYTKEELDELLASAVDSATKFKAGETHNFRGCLTGVTTGSTNRVDYITLQLPKSIEDFDASQISITYLGVGEIERIGYNASRNTLPLHDSDNASASINTTTCNIGVQKNGNYSILLTITPKSGYNWTSYQQYMTVHLRNANINISFR